MKTIVAITVLAVAIGGFGLWHAVRMPGKFGQFTGAPKAEVAALVERPKDFLGKPVTVEGRITEQCQTMGCYFSIPTGKKKLRVDLQEIAMNAPRHEGGQARVEGQLVPYGDGYQLWASAVEFK
jgi:hypothetical protein